MRRAFAFLLLAALLFAPFKITSAAAEYDPIVRIGLAYGNDALPAAKLINVAGQAEGYEFGFFDAEGQFTPLHSTDERSLAVLKDKPMWVTQGEDYYDAQPASYAYSIGPYHLQIDGAYFQGRDDAVLAADEAERRGYRAFPAYVNGEYVVRIGEFLSEDRARERQPQAELDLGYSLRICGQSATCCTVTVLGSDRILFELDSEGKHLGIMPRSTATWFKGYQYAGGFEYRRISANDITVINVISMTDYIKGVLPAEVGTNWPIEAQKAQAICAKCYTLNSLGKHKSQGFDLCNTTDCQAYSGLSRATEMSDRAVDEVYGIYATYNGEVAQTYYHSSSGGYTEDAYNIWGSEVPYLKAVEDKYLKHMVPYSVTVTLDDLTEILRSKGYTARRVKDYYVSRYSPVGNVLEVSFLLDNGEVLRMSGNRARTAINSSAKGVTIRSHRYTISGGAGFYVNGSAASQSIQGMYAIGAGGDVSQIGGTGRDVKVITGTGVKDADLSGGAAISSSYTVNGTGSGHNVGMSQWGAYDMAVEGFKYDEIIKFYFTGVEVGYWSR